MKQMGGELRASHFALGSTTQPNQFVSTMKMNFNKGDRVGAQSSVREKLNVKASHFDLGDHRNNYQTSFKAHYPAHLTFENAKLDDEKKNDLRTNHFVLGHQDGNRQSMTKQTYTEKEIHSNVHNEQEAQKIKMRAHHHTFAETGPKPMRTYYNEQYQAYPQQDLLQSNKAKEELHEKAIGLRQSHIILGKEKLPMHSIQQLEFVVKEGAFRPTVKIPLQQSHFALGTSQNDFKTVNQEFYTPQVIEKSAFAAENQENLRATHFILGQDGQPYRTESMQNYKPITQEAISYKNNLPGLQANHFSLGGPQKNTYQTQYLATMKPPAQEQQLAQTRDQRNDRGSNFVIGSMPIPYKSESNSNYLMPVDGKPANLDARLMKDLRSSHFRFNDVTSNQFKTTNEQSYNKGKGQPNVLDPQQEANLRSHHFNLGYTNNPYISTTHDTHRPLDAIPNALNPRLAKDLRSHHFELS